MARCIRKYNCSNKGEMVMSQINTYLTAQGYTYKNQDGEMVYHKGNGWISSPRYFKIQRIDDCITIEGWMKWSLLPFIAVGEMDYSDGSFVGAIPKKQMQTDAAGIERIIAQYSYDDMSGANGWNTQWSDIVTKEESKQPEKRQSNAFESGIDSTEQTMGFDHSPIDSTEKTTGFESNIPRNASTSGRVITKKEYKNSYADEKLIKDIKKAAIVGYICIGITIILGVAMFNIAILVEALIMLGLLLGMHLGKQKWCAITFLCIAIFDCIVSMIFAGSPSGWLVIIAGIWAVNSFNKIDKAYRTFALNGYKKEEPITNSEWKF